MIRLNRMIRRQGTNHPAITNAGRERRNDVRDRAAAPADPPHLEPGLSAGRATRSEAGARRKLPSEPAAQPRCRRPLSPSHRTPDDGNPRHLKSHPAPQPRIHGRRVRTRPDQDRRGTVPPPVRRRRNRSPPQRTPRRREQPDSASSRNACSYYTDRIGLEDRATVFLLFSAPSARKVPPGTSRCRCRS